MTRNYRSNNVGHVRSVVGLGSGMARQSQAICVLAVAFTNVTRGRKKQMKTTEQLRELLSVAEKATPGPWKAQRNARTEIISSVEPFEGCGWGQAVAHVYRAGKMNGTPYRMPAQANADHIAAFDPTTCAELVREVMRLKEIEANWLDAVKAGLIVEDDDDGPTWQATDECRQGKQS